jgi:hypothetical protein
MRYSFMMKYIVIGWFLVFCTIIAPGQSAQQIKGKVINKRTGEPVGFAGIHLLEADSWTTADKDGFFVIQSFYFQIITIEVHCLGFEANLGKYLVSELEPGLEIKLVPISYDMEEITVLAKNNNGIATSSVLESAAIEHIQPSSIADVLQLLPGNVSTNPDFADVKKMLVREIATDDNSAMGAALMLDGAPVSNNANLQTFSTSKTDNSFSTTAGSGVDLRQFPMDNIESIEFVTGIPSVIYGDLTSGLVLVKTKAGYSPWDLKLKSDARTKQLNLGKGFKLKWNRNLNLNVDYLQYYDDLRSKYSGYKRITADVGLSGNFNLHGAPFSYNIKLGLFGTVDNQKTDPDAMVPREKIESADKGMRLNTYGKWIPKLKLLTNLDYSFSFSWMYQRSNEERYRSLSGIQMVSTSMSEGENYGIFLPSEEFTTYTVDGKPVSLFFQLTGSKLFNFHKGISNKLLYGFDYRLDANYGDGQKFDLANPPFISVARYRPRSFREIPALQNLSYYVENKLFAMIGQTILDMQAGLRFNNFQSAGLFKTGLGFYPEPRFNIQYSFLSRRNNYVFDKMAIRFGIGKTFKSPPLIFLFPDKAYFDLSALNYYVGDPAKNISIINTQIFDTANPDLKPSRNLKLEAGIIFKIKDVKACITVFNEKLENGFGLNTNYLFLKYDQYLVENIPVNTKSDINVLDKVNVTIPVTYQKPVNNQETQKKGVEFTFDLGKIQSLYTSFTIDGAWLQTKHVYSTIPMHFQPTGAAVTPILYYGVYPAGESKVSERLNTNLRMVTHVPKLRLILSSTLQTIWFDKYYFTEYEDVPMYLVFADGSKKAFTPDMRNNPEYARFVNVKSDSYYLQEVMPPLLQVNLRLSKEIRNNMKISFFVNNFINYRPEYELKRTGSFVRRNPTMYFGAELKVML